MVTIEKLKKEDIPELLDLYQNLVPFEAPLEYAQNTYEEMLRDDNYFLIVAKENDEIVGSVLGICCHSLISPFIVIENVIVKEGNRGKGIGRKLMEAVEAFAKKKNCAYAILVSSGFRKGAHQFYEKLGFTDSVVGFRKMY